MKHTVQERHKTLEQFLRGADPLERLCASLKRLFFSVGAMSYRLAPLACKPAHKTIPTL